MQKTSYLTATEENSQQFNERDSYTTRINRLQRGFIFISPLTSDPIEEFELAPVLSLKDAAEMTQQFINELPDDIIDVELGPGI